MSQSRRPTLESVARHAAVSRQTVSNALNSPHRVRPETLDRVRAAIDELGYRPHLAARQLKTRRSRVIGLRLEPVRDGINGAVLDRFLHALTEEAQRAGYRIMLIAAADDNAEIAQYEELLGTADIDAFVLASTHHGDPRTRWLGDRGVSFVTFGRPWDDSELSAHPWVDVDGAAGTRAAVEPLWGLGHRRIGFVGWPVGSGVGDDRRAGWRSALTDRTGSPHGFDDLDAGVFDQADAGSAATRALLDVPDPPTAVVCASDSLALGAIAAATARRRNLAVVGFDDTPAAAAVGLTSVAQPLAEAAAHAVALLLHRLDGTTTPTGVPETVRLLTPHLVVRSSTT